MNLIIFKNIIKNQYFTGGNRDDRRIQRRPRGQCGESITSKTGRPSCGRRTAVVPQGETASYNRLRGERIHAGQRRRGGELMS